MSTPDADHPVYPPIRPRLSVEELLAAKNTQPIRSLDDLAADTFESDEELEEFLAFTYAERRGLSRRRALPPDLSAGVLNKSGGDGQLPQVGRRGKWALALSSSFTARIWWSCVLLRSKPTRQAAR
jgi:hypothetical protein